jgi:hypothetical protein
MRFTGKSSNEIEGAIDLLTCEHCRHEQSQPSGAKPVEDVVCRKCGMTTDKE